MKLNRLKLLVILTMSLLVLSGCFPQLKDPSEFGTPSWTVPVTVPVYKNSVNLGEQISNLVDQTEGLTVGEDGYYTYAQDLSDSFQAMTVPDLTLIPDQIGFNPDPWVSDNSIAINANFIKSEVTFDLTNVGLPAIDDQLVPPYSWNFNYSSISGGSIETPFDHARFSDSPNNKIDFTVTTNEPLDTLRISLKDASSGEVVGETDFMFPSNPTGTSIPTSTFAASISLANKVLPKYLDFEVAFGAHSTSGFITIDFQANSLDIVELSGFLPTDVNMALPVIDIADVTPLAGLAIDSLGFKSGVIRITENTSQSNPDKPFPFSVQISEFTLRDPQNPSNPKIGQNLAVQDANGCSVDLSGVIFTPTTSFDIVAAVEFVPNPAFDVYNDATETIMPYIYEFDLTFENLTIDHISGDVGAIVEDPNPDTAGVWDYKFDQISSGIMPLSIPAEWKDVNLGIADLDVTLTIDNDTSFIGSCDLTLKVYSDELGTPVQDEFGQPLQATFNLNLAARNTLEFSLNDQPDFQKMLDILNSKPDYLEFVFTGTLGADTPFRFGSGDSIKPGIAMAVPFKISVGPGGARVNGLIKETTTLNPEERDVLTQTSEFVEEGSLHIAYSNFSTLGFGAAFTFKTPQGAVKSFEIVLYNGTETMAKKGEVVFRVDRDLLAILSNESGFDMQVDLIIPNDSATSRDMGLKSTDKLDFTIWVDGKFDAHVPNQP